MDDSDWANYWSAYGQAPDWSNANTAPDDFPVCVPVACCPQQYISMPFDLRGKRRWHRDEQFRFGVYHNQPGASDAGIAVTFNVRLLCQFD